jgi:ribose-phosphate pyrophosphokinase
MTKPSIHAFTWGLAQAAKIARLLNVDCHEISEHKFPDGESLVTVRPTSGTAILFAELDHPNEKLFPLLLAADALRRNGAKRIVLVAPHLCYMRQDIAFQQGQAISQQVIGKLFAERFDRIVSVDAHLHRTPKLSDVFKGIEADNLSSAETVVEALRASHYPPDTYIAGPDEESLPLVAGIAGCLRFSHLVGTKVRRGDRTVDMTFPDSANVAGHPVVLVDDMVSSGITILTATKALLAAGAVAVDVVVTHALFPESVTQEFFAAGVRSIRSTNSIPHSTNAIDLAPLLASALRRECEGADS